MKYPVVDEIYKKYVVTNYLIIFLVRVISKLGVLINKKNEDFFK
jgi:hypothetical protein